MLDPFSGRPERLTLARGSVTKKALQYATDRDPVKRLGGELGCMPTTRLRMEGGREGSRRNRGRKQSTRKPQKRRGIKGRSFFDRACDARSLLVRVG